jgi:type VI protein secretion system component VasF
MANTDDADMDLDMTIAREPAPPSEAKENRKLALTGFWMVLAALTVVLLVGYLFISHRAHTPQISPGQPQKPAAVALLGGEG